MKKSDLSVPFSCTESWDNMSEVHQGRHCAVCQTTVYDFEAMTDEEVRNFFLNYKGGKLCGRIVEKRPTTNIIRRIANRSFSLRAIFLGLSLMAGINAHVRAGNIDPSQIEMKIGEVPFKEPQQLLPHQKNRGFIGKITQKSSNVAGAKVQVFIANKQVLETITDINGEFAAETITDITDKEYYLKITLNNRSWRTPIYKITEPMQRVSVDLEQLNRRVGKVKPKPEPQTEKVGIMINPNRKTGDK